MKTNDILACLFMSNTPWSLNHYTLYRLGCEAVSRLSFDTNLVIATFEQLLHQLSKSTHLLQREA